jgi:hypothetical protein
MRSRTTSSVADYRRRMARRGYVRVEVQVRREDASLVRGVAAALADPAREADARRLLRQRFGPARAGLKALLAAAPLDGVELDRPRDTGREVDL